MKVTKENSFEFYDAIRNDEYEIVVNMYNDGHRITNLDQLFDLISKMLWQSDIKLLQFFIDNIFIIDRNKEIVANFLHPDLNKKIIVSLVKKNIKFSESTIIKILQHKNAETYLPYFVYNYSYLPEWLCNVLDKIERGKNHFWSEIRFILKFSNEYFAELIDDKIVLMISLDDIASFGEIRTISPRKLNISETDIIRIMDNVFDRFSTTNIDKHKFAKILFFIKKYIAEPVETKDSTIFYNILVNLTKYCVFSKVIFEFFGDVIKTNLSYYFYMVVLYGQNITRKMIDFFYSMCDSNYNLCNIKTFMMFTHATPDNNLKFDDLMFVYNRDVSLRNEILSNPKKFFKGITWSFPISEWIFSIYPDEIVYEYIFWILFYKLKTVTTEVYQQIFNYVLKKYPKILTLFDLNQTVNKNRFMNDERFANFLSMYIINHKQRVKILDNNLIKLVEESMPKTINTLLNYRIIKPRNKKLFDKIVKTCELCKFSYNRSSMKNFYKESCAIYFKLLKCMAMNYDVNSWINLIDNCDISKDIMISIYQTDSNIDEITNLYLSEK